MMKLRASKASRLSSIDVLCGIGFANGALADTIAGIRAEFGMRWSATIRMMAVGFPGRRICGD
jgi:hypothetical protein